MIIQDEKLSFHLNKDKSQTPMITLVFDLALIFEW
jgi:hypothetical protein